MTPETIAVVGLVSAFIAGRATRIAELQRLRREAVTDRLTGLANRAGLTDHLDRRAAAGHEYALLLLDLDGFKEINDTHGHRAGDTVLRRVGERLTGLCPRSGIAARLGGDEFVVTAGAHADVPALANRIHRALAESVVLGGRHDADAPRVSVGSSIGVACSEPGQSPREVLHAADEAMYAAKRSRSHVAYSRRAQHWIHDAPTLRIRDVRAGHPEPRAGERSTGRAVVLRAEWYHPTID